MTSNYIMPCHKPECPDNVQCIMHSEGSCRDHFNIIRWNSNIITPSELMLDIKKLSYNQLQSLALDLTWKLMSNTKGKQTPANFFKAKRAVLEAHLRPSEIRL